MMRDPEFGPVRLRAFGTYAMKVGDPAAFFATLVATDPLARPTRSPAAAQTIVSRFFDAIGETKIAVLDLAAKLRRDDRQDAAGRKSRRSRGHGPGL